VNKTTRFGNDIQLTRATLADRSSNIEVALWDNDGKKISLGKSYKLQMVTVKLFDSVKSLSVTSSTIITEIADIGDINVDEQQVQNSITLKDTPDTVSIMTKLICLHCSKQIKLGNLPTTVITCQKCNQKMLKTKLKSTLTLKLNVGKTLVTAFNDVIQKMLSNGQEHLADDIEQLEMFLLQNEIELVHVNGIAKSITFTEM
jgi:DNA-directed RNA polymerase subunit RPC12/RpoP